ncbi:39748_t:CDS:2, partial [Gigaspora margarita]
EYRNNPKNIGLREWSPFARWKFREFNELPHLFNQRLDKSYKQANKYVDQFPREKTALLANFISFVASSLTAVLLLASIIDSEVFLGFEISPGRTVFFYLGLLVPVVAISRGMSMEDHVVFDPTVRLKKVVEHTHYSPDNWKGKLDTDDVRKEFIELFQVKIVTFFQEILGVIFTPFILWFSLPDCSHILSFKNLFLDINIEFTVHVDGLGYVCSFAVFDFKRHGNVKYGAPAEVENEYYLSKDGKMEKSFLNFKANHPDWEPTDPAGSLYLSRLNFSNQPHLERHNSARSAPIDSILKNNRRSMNNVHFGYPPGTSHYNYTGNTTTSVGINSTIEDRQPSYVHSNTSRSGRIGDQSASDFQSSPDSSQEGHYASDLSGSYILPGTKLGGTTNLTESNEPDRPRREGVIGLLNQFYELNNPSM